MTYDKIAILVVLLIVAAPSTAAWAGDDKCTVDKLQATSKKTAAKLKCHEKVTGKGDPVDPACLTKPEPKFSAAFAKAETKPPCFTTGDAAAIEAKVDAFVADVVSELRPNATPSKCSAAKLKAAGKKMAGRLNCHRQATKNGVVVDTVCLGKASVKFTEAFIKAEDKGDCLTTGDTAALEAKIDAFVADVVMEIRLVQPTRCSPDKVRHSGSKAGDKLRCYSHAVNAGSAVDPGCLSQAETKFSNGFSDAETEGDCLTIGDAAAIEAKIDAFINDVVTELVPASTMSKCSSQKLDVTGKKVERKLRCYDVAFGNGLPLNPDCLAEAEDDFSLAFSKAEVKPDCLTTGDSSAIEAKVDAFVSDAVSELLP